MGLNVYIFSNIDCIVMRIWLRRGATYLRHLGPSVDGVFVGLDLAHLDAVLHDLGFFEHLSARILVI